MSISNRLGRNKTLCGILAGATLLGTTLLPGCGRDNLSKPNPPENQIEVTIPVEGGEVTYQNYTLIFPEGSFNKPTDVTIEEEQIPLPEGTSSTNQIRITAADTLRQLVELRVEGQGNGTFVRWDDGSKGWEQRLTINGSTFANELSAWDFIDWAWEEIFGPNGECDEIRDDYNPENRLDLIKINTDFKCNQWSTYHSLLHHYFVDGDGLTEQFMNAHQNFVSDVTTDLVNFCNVGSNITFDPGNFFEILNAGRIIYQELNGNLSGNIKDSLDDLLSQYDRMTIGLISPQGVAGRALAKTSSGNMTQFIHLIHEEDYEYDHGPTVIPNALRIQREKARVLEKMIEDTDLINARAGDLNPRSTSPLDRYYGIDPTTADIALFNNIKQMAQNDLQQVREAIGYYEFLLTSSGDIIFESDRTGNKEVWKMDSDGSNEIQLTNQGASYPSCSPDGSKIVFVRDRNIWVTNSDGIGEVQLTDDTSNDAQPSWMPNGEIVFTSYIDGNWEICRMKSDRPNPTRLTYNNWIDTQPCGSLNGEIVFLSYRDGYRHLYKMDSDGSNETPLISSTYLKHPSWSPDGRFIVYARAAGPPFFDAGYRIYRINSDGSNRTDLSRVPIGQYFNEYYPSYSPDGRFIVYVSDPHNRNEEVWKMDADGSNETQLTDHPSADSKPVFNPNQ